MKGFQNAQLAVYENYLLFVWNGMFTSQLVHIAEPIEENLIKKKNLACDAKML